MTDRTELAEGLAGLLADSYSLYLLTQNYHWNVEGPMFQSLHTLFETQYTELSTAVDEIAETVRALGFYAPGTFAAFERRSRIKHDDEIPSAEEMVRRLDAAHGEVEARIREVMPLAADHDHVEDLLVQRLSVHDKARWMLRSSLEGGSKKLA